MENRDRATLFPIIQRFIRPGSHIMSDGWAAYTTIDQIEDGIYKHDVIIHDNNNFVRYRVNDDDVHTQSIENLWKHMKNKLRRQNGTSSALFKGYIYEFQWRHRTENRLFQNFMVLIAKYYPL